jgi:hypothetical protein
MAKKAKKPGVLTTEGDVLSVLRHRHSGDEWVFLSHLKTATGWQTGRGREVDGWAMNMWPSRGLKTHGFEVKVSRSDWLSELKNPDKADEGFQFCDFWWLVVGDASIVQDGELPTGWGLMVPHRGGLKIKVQATEREAEFDRAFWASCLRNMQRTNLEEKERREIESREYDRGYKEGRKSGEAKAKAKIESATLLAEKTLASVRTFEELTGVSISSYEGGVKRQAKLFKALEVMLEGDFGGRFQGRLKNLRDQTAKSLQQFDDVLAEMAEIGGDVEGAK